MKNLPHETLNKENIPEKRICLISGNKNMFLGFFDENRQFWALSKNTLTALPYENVFVWVVTEFCSEEIEKAKTVYTEEIYEKEKERVLGERPKYTAAILTQKSGEILFEKVSHSIPHGWTINCHHMTVCLGTAMKEVEAEMGNEIELNIVGFGHSEEFEVSAVLVETTLFSKNTIKHITVALNKEGGARAVNSNKINSFVHIEPFTLIARVDTVLQNGKTMLGSEEYTH